MKSVFDFVSVVRPFDFASVDVKRVDSVEKTVVYSFDVITGTVKEKLFNLAFPRIVKEAFRDFFLKCWYNREAAKASEKANAFEEAAKAYQEAKSEDEEEASSKINISEEEEKALSEAVKSVRFNESKLSSLLETVKAVRVDDVPFTVRVFVCAVRKEKFDSATMEYCDSVDKAIRDMRETAIDEKTNQRDLTKVKKALSEAVKNLWKEEEDVILPYHITVNSGIAERIWQVSYKGTAIDKDGRLYSKNANSSEVVREVIFEVFKALNAKEAKAKEAREAVKEAAKDEQLSQASKPKPKRETVKKEAAK